jgi:membrane protein YqaA with SNARE-associated domain
MEDIQTTKKTSGLKARLERWIYATTHHRYAEGWLGFIAFIESSFFPIPPDVILIPMVSLKREKWVRLATITTLASVAGAILGYFIGAFLFDAIGQQLVDVYHLQEDFVTVGNYFEQAAFLTILVSAFTPIPYKVFTIAAGLFGISFLPFVLASIIGRGARFFIEGILMARYGERIMKFVLRYLEIAVLVVVIGVLVTIFVL